MNLFQGWYSISWPTCFLTMEAPAVHLPHRKHLLHFSFTFDGLGSLVKYLGRPFVWQVQHGAVWRLCVEPGKPGHCRHGGQVWFLILVKRSTHPFFSVDIHILFLQLLEQLENTDPAPAEKDMISSLPTVCISQEQTGNTMNVWPGWRGLGNLQRKTFITIKTPICYILGCKPNVRFETWDAEHD